MVTRRWKSLVKLDKERNILPSNNYVLHVIGEKGVGGGYPQKWYRHGDVYRLAQESELNLSSVSHAREGTSNLTSLADMMLASFLSLLVSETDADEAEARVFHVRLPLRHRSRQQVLHDMGCAPGLDLFSKGTVRHKLGHR
jgi:hypothetical protein